MLRCVVWNDCDECLKNKSGDYQNCSVLYCNQHTHVSRSFKCLLSLGVRVF